MHVIIQSLRVRGKTVLQTGSCYACKVSATYVSAVMRLVQDYSDVTDLHR